MLVNADLHIHSKYSMATSPKMELPTLASESRKKGIQLVATGDPASVQDIPRWAKRAGHQFLKLFKEGENFHFLIRKGK